MNYHNLFQEYIFNEIKILEIGCNVGKISKIISDNFNCNLIGIDNKNIFKNDFDNLLKDKAKFKKIDFFSNNDLSQLGHFDLVFYRDIFNSFDRKFHQEIFDNIFKNNCKNGTIIIINEFSSFTKYLSNTINFLLRRKLKKINFFNINNTKLQGIEIIRILNGDFFTSNFKNFLYKIFNYKKIYILKCIK
tara:strand:+ start:2189 stop:2758 length:570 start_codon:yes stop_codon:yes gene_type:complete